MRRPAAALVFVLAAAAFGGCGQSERAAPASLVPVGSIVYGEVVLDPKGDQQDAVKELAARFPGGDDLSEQIDKGLTESFREDGLDYEKDVKPWLGDEAVFFLSEASGEDAEGAVVIETDDGDAALKAFEKGSKGKAKKRSYEGTDVFVEQETAYAVVDDHAVIGTEKGVRETIDTSKEGADSIEDSERANEALDRLDDPLAAVYVDGRKLVGAVGGAQAELLAPLLDAFDEPYVVGFSAESDAVVVESTLPRELTGFLLPFAFGSGTDALEQLPADAWLAAGQPEIGKTIAKLLDLVEQSGAFGAQIEEGFKTATQLDLREDVLSWMGDLTLFSRGTSVADLEAGLAIQTSDPAASRRTLSAVRRLVARGASDGEEVQPLSLPGGGDGFTLASPELPESVHFALRDEEVVIGYGDAATEELFEPTDALGDDQEFNAAAERLGSGFVPATYLEFAPILELAENEGATSDPEFLKALPYLEPLVRVVAGTKEDGDVVVSRTRVEVR